MPSALYLPDVNVLLALSDRAHEHHSAASSWFGKIGSGKLVLCPVTEAGFVRLSANPRVGGRDIEVALAMLQTIKALPNCIELLIDASWMNLVAPFAANLHGYRQVTDAFLLGIALRHEAVLVTFDRHIQALCGPQFRSSIVTLEKDTNTAP